MNEEYDILFWSFQILSTLSILSIINILFIEIFITIFLFIQNFNKCFVRHHFYFKFSIHTNNSINNFYIKKILLSILHSIFTLDIREEELFVCFSLNA